MSELTQADRYLLAEIRRGGEDGWDQLVGRHQGRLLAFARGQVRDEAEAEDLVQETFLAFLQGLDRYREQAGIETYLFVILRRKIINWVRGRRTNICSLQDLVGAAGEETDMDPAARIPGAEPTASWYARRDETHDLQRTALSAALRKSIEHYKDSLSFRDLRIIEMIFYSQLRNKDVSATAGVSQQQVALIKHRFIKQVRQRLGPGFPDGSSHEPPDALLSQIWQDGRMSCPKRSTVGAWLLGTLDPEWREYVRFHLERLGCAFCQANVEDLRRQEREAEHTRSFRNRIMESTVGFLSG